MSSFDLFDNDVFSSGFGGRGIAFFYNYNIRSSSPGKLTQ